MATHPHGKTSGRRVLRRLRLAMDDGLHLGSELRDPLLPLLTRLEERRVEPSLEEAESTLDPVGVLERRRGSERVHQHRHPDWAVLSDLVQPPPAVQALSVPRDHSQSPSYLIFPKTFIV